MTTYLLRHGRTQYSSRYLVNGDPTLPVPLDEEGVRACVESRSELPAEAVRTWVTSAFPRAQQTAKLLMGKSAAPVWAVPRLNELDYGDFEGSPFLEYAAWLQGNGPWLRPPGAGESQREGFRRMLRGVLEALGKPAPRIIVGHGLLLSVLGWDLVRTPGTTMPIFFPEAPYLAPLIQEDDELAQRSARLLDELEAQNQHEPHVPGDAAETGREAASILATVKSLSTPPEEKPSHA